MPPCIPTASTSLAAMHVSLSDLRALVGRHDLLAPRVSASPVGWHIEHTALTIDIFLQGLERSDPGLYRPGYDPRKLLALWIGWIPRGVVQTPASFRPKTTTDEQTLLDHLERTAASLGAVPGIPPDAWMRHPVLGPLRRDAVLRFLDVHSRHHLKIIRDIERAAR